MKLIESKVEIIEQEPGLDGIYKNIEKASRLCYKSEDKICEGSAEKMVENLMKRGHGSPLEHGTIYLVIPYDVSACGRTPFHKYAKNPYSKVIHGDTMDINYAYITTNYRVLVENGWLDDLQYLCEPTEYHEKRYSVKITCSRSIANEFVRHRVMSFCQESQRYVGYDKERFGGEIVFIIPDWVKILMNDLSEDDFADCQYEDVKCWWEFMRYTEFEYMRLMKLGRKPQEARSVLNNDCKTELMITGFASDWKHFFKLRTAISAHPDARAIACPLEAEFKLKGYIE